MLNTFNFNCLDLHFEKKNIVSPVTVQSSILVLTTIQLCHIVMLSFLLYYTAILKEIILAVN